MVFGTINGLVVKKTNMNLKANEVVVKAGDSIQWINKEKYQGKLIITNQRIYFKPKEENRSDLWLELMPSQILEVIFFNSMKLIPNGLDVITKSGENYRFTLKRRNEFGQLINRMY